MHVFMHNKQPCVMNYTTVLLGFSFHAFVIATAEFINLSLSSLGDSIVLPNAIP